jgi:putative flippase GtrA
VDTEIGAPGLPGIQLRPASSLPDRPQPVHTSLDLSYRGSGRKSLYECLRHASLVAAALRLPAVQKMLAPTRGNQPWHRFVRYSMVSAVAIIISQVTILICAGALGLSGIMANTIGAFAATPASYELNRKWAWGRTGKSHLWRETVPFWALTVVGYLASTGTVQIADTIARSHGLAHLDRALTIMGASLFAYGVIWVAKFVIFNRLLFVDRSPDARPAGQMRPAPR